MALYDFKCKNEKCGKEFEARVPIKDYETVKDDIKCPDCNSPVERLISGLRTMHTTWKNWRL